MEYLVSIKTPQGTTHQRIASSEGEAESIAETARQRGEDPLILPRRWFQSRAMGNRN